MAGSAQLFHLVCKARRVANGHGQKECDLRILLDETLNSRRQHQRLYRSGRPDGKKHLACAILTTSEDTTCRSAGSPLASSRRLCQKVHLAVKAIAFDVRLFPRPSPLSEGEGGGYAIGASARCGSPSAGRQSDIVAPSPPRSARLFPSGRGQVPSADGTATSTASRGARQLRCARNWLIANSVTLWPVGPDDD